MGYGTSLKGRRPHFTNTSLSHCDITNGQHKPSPRSTTLLETPTAVQLEQVSHLYRTRRVLYSVPNEPANTVVRFTGNSSVFCSGNKGRSKCVQACTGHEGFRGLRFTYIGKVVRLVFPHTGPLIPPPTPPTFPTGSIPIR